MTEFIQSNIVGLTVPTKGHRSVVMESGGRMPLSDVLEAFVDQVKAGDQRASIVEAEPAPDAVSDPDPPDDAGSGLFDPTEYKVVDVMEYLKTADPAEVDRVKAEEAAGDRAGGPSTTIASYEASD